jgi:hypothetical protein
MVFYVVACHLANKEEEQVERVLRSQLGTGAKTNGELYNIEVRIYLIGEDGCSNCECRSIRAGSRSAH